MARNWVGHGEVEELRRMAASHFWPHGWQLHDLSEETAVILVRRGRGVWVEDVEGKRWFDLMAGMWLVHIGHGRKEVAQAVHSQIREISHSPVGTVSPITVRLAATVAALAPDKQSRVYFVNSGSEAVEVALRIARLYHTNRGEPARWKVMSRRGSSHGATYACTGLGGGEMGVCAGSERLMRGNVYVAQPGSSCPYCQGKVSCTLECARDVEREVVHEDPLTVAAFIGEPISVSAGIHVPHPDYWPTVRAICSKYGILLICDEVITGFGRTGRMFAMEHWGIAPDIIAVAKGLSSGYAPIGAAIVSKKIADVCLADEGSALGQVFTSGGNPASCAAALANLEILQSERMVENSAKMGTYLYGRLERLRRHPVVRDVRGGKGLLCAVEITGGGESKPPFSRQSNRWRTLNLIMRKHGLLGQATSIIPVAPSLCITKEEVDYLAMQLDQVIAEVASAPSV